MTRIGGPARARSLPPGSATNLGAPIDRLDGHAKTHGQATYAADVHPDGLAYAALVHATVPRATIRGIDTTAADQLPGVIAVLTHLNAPKTKAAPKPGIMSPAAQAAPSTVDVLRTDEVHFDGQPVAVVVAETLDIAQHAARLVAVDLQARPAVVDFAAEAAREGASEKLKAPFILTVRGSVGDAKRALTQAAVTVTQEYTTPELSHNAIELHATTAWWEGDHLTVHEGTQAIDPVAHNLAARFDIPKDHVRLSSSFTGGAFGGKSHVWPHTYLAVLAAKAVGRPVQLVLTREGVYRTVGGRTASRQQVGLGASTDGALTAIVHEATTRLGRTGGHPEQVTSATHDLYAAPNIHHDQRAVRLDLVPNTFMRAPGEAIGTFALETAMDELAEKLSLDPIELRLRNQPHRAPVDGKEFTHHRVPELLRMGAELFGWSQRTPQPGSMRDGNHHVGWGVALAYHPAMRIDANLTLTAHRDGRVTVRCGFQEMGMGTATAVAQLTAHLLGMPVGQVTVDYGESDLPTAPPAGASVQTASIAASLEQAAGKLRAELGVTESDQLGARLAARGADLTVEIGADSGMRAMLGQARMFGRLIQEGRSISRAASGVQFCEVRVDADTGELRLSRWLGIFDIGRVVNAKLAQSQLRGGIVMGVGLALSEATLIDPNRGRVMSASLTEYHVPVHADIPHLDIHILDDPDPSMPLGVVGAGEVGVTGVAAAIANAVHHATGSRVRDLPITLDKTLGRPFVGLD